MNMYVDFFRKNRTARKPVSPIDNHVCKANIGLGLVRLFTVMVSYCKLQHLACYVII